MKPYQKGRKPADGEGKHWNLCTAPGCNYRGTHSDGAGPSMRCGMHYYAAHGEQALKEGEARDAEAREQEIRLKRGGPRYLKIEKAAT